MAINPLRDHSNNGVPSDIHNFGEGSDNNPSDTSSDMTEVNPDDFPSYFERRDGRLFPSVPSSNSHVSPYPLPVDGLEQQRLQVQNNILREVIGANYVGPVRTVLSQDAGGQKRVVDLCTGNGKWVLEMAAEFGHVQFNGLDIVPIATRYPPDNVYFEIHDVSTPTRWSDSTIDFVHARGAAMAVRDVPRLLQEVGRILRPGGLFLSGEWGRYIAFDPEFDVDSQGDIPGIRRFWNVINSTLEARGILPVAAGIPVWLLTTGQFTAITPQQFHVPIGSWHQDPGMKRIGRAMRSSLKKYADALKPMLRLEGWQESDLDELIVALMHDVRTVRGLVGVFHTVHARKV